MTNDNPLLSVNGIEVFYGETQALFGVSLDVYEGELVTMIGGNGAGKSTTLRTISGLLTPRSGSITFDDQKISEKSPEEIVSLGIAQAPEGRMLFPELTVLENLRAGAYHRSDDIEEDLEEVYDYFPQLSDLLDQRANDLSGGQQQMLTIGRALMSDPDLLLMDEPSLGLAPQLVKTIGGIVQDLRDDGQTILLVEQNAELALDIADRGYVLQTGEVVASGTTEELRDTEEVQAAYFGGE
ncbi:MAG: ABC transporter ATP-binding protein [Halanaeroarchaeum sp.]